MRISDPLHLRKVIFCNNRDSRKAIIAIWRLIQVSKDHHRATEAHSGAVNPGTEKAHPGAVEAFPGAIVAQTGAMEAHLCSHGCSSSSYGGLPKSNVISP
jgi:hypothetical protein